MTKDNYYESDDFRDIGFKPLMPQYYPRQYQDYIAQETELLKQIVPGKIVLEAGVGIGRLIPILGPLAKEFVGVDNADQMLEEARKQTKDLQNVRIVKTDLETLAKTFPEKYFDISLCVWNTLGNVADEVDVLSELAKITKEKIIVTVHLKGQFEARKNWYKTVGIEMDNIDEKNEIFYSTKSGLRSKSYSLEEISQFAEKAGLRVYGHQTLAGVVLWAELS